jgi:hypothetical protein
MSISRRQVAVSVVCCLCLAAPLRPPSVHPASTIYTYTDDAGTQTFTTELHSIPDRYRSRVVPFQSDFGTPPEIEPAPPPVSAESQPLPSADVRTVTAGGEHRMGDHDRRTDAVRLAVEAAKKDALEQVAVYLESVTEVRNLDVTRDDIRTYTAGIVTVLDQTITTRLEGDTVVIRADITAQVDPNEVVRAIASLRDNESARSELLALRTETDHLQQQLDAANRALAAATSPEQIHIVTQQREDMLNRLQANALVSQAWTNWVYVTPGMSPWIAAPHVKGLLLQAQRLHPRSRHLPHVRQMMRAQIGSQPPAPPGLSPPSLPGHSLMVPTPPNPRPSAPPPHQLHPSHFWRPSPPNIHMSPSMSQPNTFVSPRQFGGHGKQFSGGRSGPGHFRGGSGGNRGR